MSDKPKIYGFCNAGSKWETVHKDDFEASAALIRQYADSDGVYRFSFNDSGNLVKPKLCLKIYSNSNSEKSAYTATVKLKNVVGNDVEFQINEYDDCKDYFYFELLKIEKRQVQDYMQINTYTDIVYEVNGNRYKETFNGMYIHTELALLEITGATNVLLCNTDADTTAIQGEKGDTGAKIVSTELQGQDDNGGNIYKQTFDDGSTANFTAPRGATGAKGDTGVGVPTGGTTGQVLKKKSGTDYDTEWGDGGGGVSDYNDLSNKPIINRDLNDKSQSLAPENYYRHIGTNNDMFRYGKIYYVSMYGGDYGATELSTTTVICTKHSDFDLILGTNFNAAIKSYLRGGKVQILIPESEIFSFVKTPIYLDAVGFCRNTTDRDTSENEYYTFTFQGEGTQEIYTLKVLVYKILSGVYKGDYRDETNEFIVSPLLNKEFRGGLEGGGTVGSVLRITGSGGSYIPTAEWGRLSYDYIDQSPIKNIDLSNLSNPTAYTYYRHTGETTDKFEKGSIYYRDAMGYVNINNAPFVLPLQKDANGNLQVQTSKLKQALEAFSQGSIVYLREFFYSSQEDTTPYGAANYMAVRVSGSYASGEINNNQITFVDIIGDGCTEYIINSAPGDYANVIKKTYKFVECPQGIINEDNVYTVTSIEDNTPYLDWRPKHNPVITGGGLAKLYFDKTQTPDLSGFEYTYDESMQMDASPIISNWKMALVAVRFGEAGNYVYGVVYIDANDNPTILYVSSDFVYKGVNLSAGWQTIDNPITLNGVVIANDSISTVSGWNGVWVGREPFYATREYAKSATILASPNGTKYRIKVADDGTLSTEAVTA